MLFFANIGRESIICKCIILNVKDFAPEDKFGFVIPEVVFIKNNYSCTSCFVTVGVEACTGSVYKVNALVLNFISVCMVVAEEHSEHVALVYHSVKLSV